MTHIYHGPLATTGFSTPNTTFTTFFLYSLFIWMVFRFCSVESFHVFVLYKTEMKWNVIHSFHYFSALNNAMKLCLFVLANDFSEWKSKKIKGKQKSTANYPFVLIYSIFAWLQLINISSNDTVSRQMKPAQTLQMSWGKLPMVLKDHLGVNLGQVTSCV